MNLGKLVRKQCIMIRDLTTDQLHAVKTPSDSLKFGEYYSFEINEDDDAVDLVHAADALQAMGINAGTMSFYVEQTSDEESADADEAEAFFGTCELTGMRGDIVPCLYLDNEGNVQRGEFGSWLVHSVLGKLAGAF